jgi:hypothetical protein
MSGDGIPPVGDDANGQSGRVDAGPAADRAPRPPVGNEAPDPPGGEAAPTGSDESTHARRSKPAPNPLHGVTLERMLNELVEHFGWPAMGERVRIRCFTSDPSISSSLRFLRRTPWAREKVEAMYLYMLREKARAGRGR